MYPRSGIRVLVVDDELAATFERALQRKGYDVRAATSLAEARECTRDWLPDVALVDWLLGDATGEDVCTALRALRPPPIVIVITGQDGEDLQLRSYRAGACSHLPKPVNLDEVDLLIRRLYEARQEGSMRPAGCPPFEVDDELEQVLVGGKPLPGFTKTQRDLLKLLSANTDRVVHWQRLQADLGLASLHSTEELISATRKNLGEHGELIETIRGAGVIVRSKRND